MLALETLSTDGLPMRQRVEFWNEVACSTFVPQYVDPADKTGFCGSLKRRQVGSLRFIEGQSTPVKITRSKTQVARTHEAFFFVHLQCQGTILNRQGGRESLLAPGDFTLCDSTRPYSIAIPEHTVSLVLRIPAPLVRRYIPCPDDMIMLPMSGSRGASGLASRLMQDIWRCALQDVSAATCARMEAATLELLGAAYSEVPVAKTNRRASGSAVLYPRVVDFIEANLHDSDLSPAVIATALRISTRYLHMLFAAREQTVSGYILQRRLQRCHRVLVNPLRQHLSITTIAYEYGFKSLPHFCRVFRARYGATPLAVRRGTTLT